ncbi:hypothetical protein B0H13DRAFT_1949859, partial [Mycena leptocephala]
NLRLYPLLCLTHLHSLLRTCDAPLPYSSVFNDIHIHLTVHEYDVSRLALAILALLALGNCRDPGPCPRPDRPRFTAHYRLQE